MPNSSITFSRAGLFFCGFVLMILAFLGQRIYVYDHSSFTYGVLCFKEPDDRQYYETDMILYYYVDSKELTKEVHLRTSLAYEKVSVYYPIGKPEKAKVYTITDFWCVAALWLLLPLMLWGAIVFTFFRENSCIEMRIGSANEDRISK